MTSTNSTNDTASTNGTAADEKIRVTLDPDEEGAGSIDTSGEGDETAAAAAAAAGSDEKKDPAATEGTAAGEEL